MWRSSLTFLCCYCIKNTRASTTPMRLSPVLTFFSLSVSLYHRWKVEFSVLSLILHLPITFFSFFPPLTLLKTPFDWNVAAQGPKQWAKVRFLRHSWGRQSCVLSFGCHIREGSCLEAGLQQSGSCFHLYRHCYCSEVLLHGSAEADKWKVWRHFSLKIN